MSKTLKFNLNDIDENLKLIVQRQNVNCVISINSQKIDNFDLGTFPSQQSYATISQNDVIQFDFQSENLEFQSIILNSHELVLKNSPKFSLWISTRISDIKDLFSSHNQEVRIQFSFSIQNFQSHQNVEKQEFQFNIERSPIKGMTDSQTSEQAALEMEKMIESIQQDILKIEQKYGRSDQNENLITNLKQESFELAELIHHTKSSSDYALMDEIVQKKNLLKQKLNWIQQENFDSLNESESARQQIQYEEMNFENQDSTQNRDTILESSTFQMDNKFKQYSTEQFEQNMKTSLPSKKKQLFQSENNLKNIDKAIQEESSSPEISPSKLIKYEDLKEHDSGSIEYHQQKANKYKNSMVDLEMKFSTMIQKEQAQLVKKDNQLKETQQEIKKLQKQLAEQEENFIQQASEINFLRDQNDKLEQDINIIKKMTSEVVINIDNNDKSPNNVLKDYNSFFTDDSQSIKRMLNEVLRRVENIKKQHLKSKVVIHKQQTEAEQLKQQAKKLAEKYPDHSRSKTPTIQTYQSQSAKTIKVQSVKKSVTPSKSPNVSSSAQKEKEQKKNSYQSLSKVSSVKLSNVAESTIQRSPLKVLDSRVSPSRSPINLALTIADIDPQLDQAIRRFQKDNNLQNVFERQPDGSFRFGKKNFNFTAKNQKLYVKLQGGYMDFQDYLKAYSIHQLKKQKNVNLLSSYDIQNTSPKNSPQRKSLQQSPSRKKYYDQYAIQQELNLSKTQSLTQKSNKKKRSKTPIEKQMANPSNYLSFGENDNNSKNQFKLQKI